MTKLSQLSIENKTLRVVQYTSGTATFTPLVPNSWCRVTLVAGGSAGSPGTVQYRLPTLPDIYQGGTGGSAGSTCVYWVRVTAPVTVIVGAGGNSPGSHGSATLFGSLVAAPASGPGNAVVFGGYLSNDPYTFVNQNENRFNNATQRQLGMGSSSPLPGLGTLDFDDGTGGNPPTGNGGNGASSFYGTGGVFSARNATGYGSGGYGQSATTGLFGTGSGGLVIVEEFGA